MGGLYASALCTSVLRHRLMPERSARLDGAVRVFGAPRETTDEAAIRLVLDDDASSLTKAEWCDDDESLWLIFASQSAAVAAVGGDEPTTKLRLWILEFENGWMMCAYNDRAYDDRGCAPEAHHRISRRTQSVYSLPVRTRTPRTSSSHSTHVYAYA